MKLHQQLEQIFKFISLSKKENIPGFMKRVTELGKFDEPKKAAVLSMLCKRLADAEDVLEEQKIAIGFLENDIRRLKGKKVDKPTPNESGIEVTPQESTSVTDSSGVSPVVTASSADESPELEITTRDAVLWKDLVAEGTQLGVYKFGMTREALEAAVTQAYKEKAAKTAE